MSVILGKGRCWDRKQILVIRGALMGVRKETLLSAGNLSAVAWVAKPFGLIHLEGEGPSSPQLLGCTTSGCLSDPNLSVQVRVQL